MIEFGWYCLKQKSESKCEVSHRFQTIDKDMTNHAMQYTIATAYLSVLQSQIRAEKQQQNNL